MSKVRIGAIDENLVNKTRRYKELTGTTTVELVEKLLSEFFKEIKLTNDYINIDEIYYFNFKKPINEKIILHLSWGSYVLFLFVGSGN